MKASFLLQSPKPNLSASNPGLTPSTVAVLSIQCSVAQKHVHFTIAYANFLLNKVESHEDPFPLTSKICVNFFKAGELWAAPNSCGMIFAVVVAAGLTIRAICWHEPFSCCCNNQFYYGMMVGLKLPVWLKRLAVIIDSMLNDKRNTWDHMNKANRQQQEMQSRRKKQAQVAVNEESLVYQTQFPTSRHDWKIFYYCFKQSPNGQALRTGFLLLLIFFSVQVDELCRSQLFRLGKSWRTAGLSRRETIIASLLPSSAFMILLRKDFLTCSSEFGSMLQKLMSEQLQVGVDACCWMPFFHDSHLHPCILQLSKL